MCLYSTIHRQRVSPTQKILNNKKTRDTTLSHLCRKPEFSQTAFNKHVKNTQIMWSSSIRPEHVKRLKSSTAAVFHLCPRYAAHTPWHWTRPGSQSASWGLWRVSPRWPESESAWTPRGPSWAGSWTEAGTGRGSRRRPRDGSPALSGHCIAPPGSHGGRGRKEHTSKKEKEKKSTLYNLILLGFRYQFTTSALWAAFFRFRWCSETSHITRNVICQSDPRRKTNTTKYQKCEWRVSHTRGHGMCPCRWTHTNYSMMWVTQTHNR